MRKRIKFYIKKYKKGAIMTTTFSDRYNIWMYHSNETTEDWNVLICAATEMDGKDVIVYNDNFNSLSPNAQNYVAYRTLFLLAFEKANQKELPADLSLHIMADAYAVGKIGKQNALDAFYESLKLLGVDELDDDLKQREAIIKAL